MVLGFYNVHDKINFNKEVNRLIWAIHFITTVSEKEYIKKCNYYEIPF
jgi:hypothetical protein